MDRIWPILLVLLFASCGDSHIVNDEAPILEGVQAGCELHFKTENLCLKAEWELMPTDSTVGSMVLTFTDKTNPNLLITPKNDPFLVLWMPSMEHGSSPVTVELIETGKYRINDIFFIMPGPWDLRYQLKDGDHVTDQVIEKIEI